MVYLNELVVQIHVCVMFDSQKHKIGHLTKDIVYTQHIAYQSVTSGLINVRYKKANAKNDHIRCLKKLISVVESTRLTSNFWCLL